MQSFIMEVKPKTKEKLLLKASNQVLNVFCLQLIFLGKYDILVTTDLGQRGLDVEGVKYVINFDAPKDISAFIHRTGRTGRAGKKGVAITFLTGKNEELFYDLKNFLVQNGQNVPQELAEHAATKVKPGTVDAVPRRKQVIYAQ